MRDSIFVNTMKLEKFRLGLNFMSYLMDFMSLCEYPKAPQFPPPPGLYFPILIYYICIYVYRLEFTAIYSGKSPIESLFTNNLTLTEHCTSKDNKGIVHDYSIMHTALKTPGYLMYMTDFYGARASCTLCTV